MSSGTQKKLLAGCLVVGAVVTWFPQLLSAGQSEKRPRPIDLPAETAWDGQASARASPMIAPRMFSPNARDESASVALLNSDSRRDIAPVERRLEAANLPAARARIDAQTTAALSPSIESASAFSSRTVDLRSGSASTSGGGSDLVASLEHSLAIVHSVLPRYAPIDLDEMARAWSRDLESRRVVEIKQEARTSAEIVRTSQPAPRESAHVDPVEAFLADHPLNGILGSQGRKLANLGLLLVGEGDELIPGILTVKSIETCAVILSTTSGDRRIELATITPRPAVDDERPRPGVGEPKFRDSGRK